MHLFAPFFHRKKKSYSWHYDWCPDSCVVHGELEIGWDKKDAAGWDKKDVAGGAAGDIVGGAAGDAASGNQGSQDDAYTDDYR